MKAVILAGGFASRMWPLTKNIPKALLPVAGKPIMEYCIEKLLAIKAITTIYITTNRHFEHYFSEWLEQSGYMSDVRLVVEPHRSEDEKLGSVGALKSLIDEEKISDDFLVLAGDNLLEDNLHAFMEFFRDKGEVVFGLHDMGSGDLCKFGIACVDDSGKVVDFEEKPDKPKSSFVSTAIYAIPKHRLKSVSEYLKETSNPDAFGHFISWLYSRLPVYGFVFRNKWFDIGSFQSYREANEYMHKEKE